MTLISSNWYHCLLIRTFNVPFNPTTRLASPARRAEILGYLIDNIKQREFLTSFRECPLNEGL